MANIDVMYSSKTDQWATPDDFFRELDQEFHFNQRHVMTARTLAGILYHTEAQQQQCSEVATKKMK